METSSVSSVNAPGPTPGTAAPPAPRAPAPPSVAHAPVAPPPVTPAPVSASFGGAGAPPPPPKAWYASAGVWGALVTLAGSVLALLKVEVDPRLLADVREWVLAAVTLAGGGVALWGRLRASRRIGASPADVPKPPTLPPPTSAVGLRVRVLMVLLAPTLVAGAAGGCAALVGPGGPYVAADRATFEAVAPEYRAYVDADVTLDADQRARRQRTLDLWRVRVEDAEGRGARNGEPALFDTRGQRLASEP